MDFTSSLLSLCSNSPDGASACTFGINSENIVQAVLALLQFNPNSFSGANFTAPSGSFGRYVSGRQAAL